MTAKVECPTAVCHGAARPAEEPGNWAWASRAKHAALLHPKTARLQMTPVRRSMAAGGTLSKTAGVLFIESFITVVSSVPNAGFSNGSTAPATARFLGKLGPRVDRSASRPTPSGSCAMLAALEEAILLSNDITLCRICISNPLETQSIRRVQSSPHALRLHRTSYQ